MFKVVILDHSFGNIQIERDILEPMGAKVYEYQCNDPVEAAELAKDADAVLVTNFKTLTRETIYKLEKCKIIVKHGIGPDIVDVDAATERGIMVANVPDYCLNEVSNHAVALTLTCARKIFEADKQVRTILDHKVFELRPILPLYESTMGIIGFGRIGRITAKSLSVFGCNIIFYDPFFNDDGYDVDGVKARKVSLDEIYRESDYILIHAPLTKDNYHMINKDSFNKMSKKPYIINVGRGELIDNNALVEALNKNFIKGAALDVVEGMPPISKNDPLLNNEKVILTPHCAWYSEGSYRKLQTKGAMEVKRVLSGEKPVSWYNKKDMLKK